MKAAVIHAYGSPDELKFEDVPDPSPGPGEVLIRTAATSINPLEDEIRGGQGIFPLCLFPQSWAGMFLELWRRSGPM